jgi:threonine aldolase
MTPAVDLRSDTVTRPTAALLDEMRSAKVGDDVYGEDPSVNELEYEVARLLGKDSALFVPSGTMGNQLAIALHTRPGDAVITEAGAHTYCFEVGAAAAISQVQFDLVPRGERLSDQAIDKVFRPDGTYNVATTLLAVENTHNQGCGRVLRVDEMQRIALKARSLNMATHCDGARLWNAAAALRVKERELIAGFDTVSVCFSKGLGAPVGSALCGPKPLILKARKLRKRWGGGMRQAGFLAAGALHGLRHHRERLADDHRRARELAEALTKAAVPGISEVEYPERGTNLVFFRIAGTDENLHIKALAERGVLIGAMAGGWLRAVLHLDVTEAAFEQARQVLVRYLASQT